MNAHRLAKYFPILEGEEFQMLVEDVRKNGQLNPIITYKGEILDGINRYRACEAIGIAPVTEEYTGDDPLSYVVSINVRRRHMDTSQRAMLATEMLPEFEAEAAKRLSEHRSMRAKEQRSSSSGSAFGPAIASKDTYAEDDRSGKAAFQAAKVFGVSGPTIQRAKRIQQEAPERVQDIISGRATVTAVDQELREAKAEERQAKVEEKEIKKTPAEHPKAVKDYLSACLAYRDALDLAIRAAKAGMFDPSAINMVEGRHNSIRGLMDQVESLI